MASDDINASECTTKEMNSMIKLKSNTETYYHSVIKRFKILALLAANIDVWEYKMIELANKIDDNDVNVLEALNYYENAIISILEAKEDETLRN
jgi:hypothetical protein